MSRPNSAESPSRANGRSRQPVTDPVHDGDAPPLGFRCDDSPSLPIEIEGWFPVLFSYELKRGRTGSVRFMGHEFVLWRSESGQVLAFEAFCPHLGTHMKDGIVRGETIVCPFHFHSYNRDGVRVNGREMCTKERFKTLPVDEVNDTILVWYGRSAPRWTVRRRDFHGWTPLRRFNTWHKLVTAHPQDIQENNVDVAHFGPVHQFVKYRPLRDYDFSGHELINSFETELPLLRIRRRRFIKITTHVEFHLEGIGCAVAHIEMCNVTIGRRNMKIPERFRFRHRIFSGMHMRDRDHTVMHFGGSLRHHPLLSWLPGPLGRRIHQWIGNVLIRTVARHQFAGDLRIWMSKAYLAHPILDTHDGPILAYRAWCKQFYPGV